MITNINSQSPNFGAFHKLNSFSALGAEGKSAMDISLPSLKDLTEDCDIFVGSIKNPETGKSHLAVWAANLRESFAPNEFFGSIFFKQSNASAINPASLLTNIGQTRISVLGNVQKSTDDYEKIILSKGFSEKNTEHNRFFELTTQDFDEMSLDTLCEPTELFDISEIPIK